MPKVQLKETAASDAAIAANASRIFVEFCALSFGDVRWCFGATFVAADSQLISPGTARPFEGLLAQQAFSFGPGKGEIDVTLL